MVFTVGTMEFGLQLGQLKERSPFVCLTQDVATMEFTGCLIGYMGNCSLYGPEYSKYEGHSVCNATVILISILFALHELY